jgi:hypothetical protein
MDVDHMDVDTVSTPTGQQGLPYNYNNPGPPAYNRTASVSSIASSVSNFQTNDQQLNLAAFATNYRLTDQFEQLLLDTYTSHQLDPTTTPFNESSPPSGVLNTVARNALQLAMEQEVDVGIELNNYALTIIRQKLIQLVRTPPGRASRTSSMSSLNNIPQLNLQTRFAQQQPFTPTEGYFSFESPMTPVTSSAIGGALQSPAHLQPSFHSEAAGSTTPPVGQLDNIPEGLFNATVNRKRESLRLKRSGNQASF